MMIKFLAHGRGRAARAADYLLGARDAAGRARVGVEVLHGDPHTVAAVADALPHRHRYSSAVIAWAPEDRPTAGQIQQVVDGWAAVAYAGMAADRAAWTAIQHYEPGGGVHVHILAARCDLRTGRAHNPAPPGWQRLYDPLRDSANARHGWARPDDPARARTHQPGHTAYIAADRLRAGLAVEPDPRQVITDYIRQRIASGQIRGRDDILGALSEARLEVPRAGRDYVTVRDPVSGRRWRMRGAIYHEDWSPPERPIEPSVLPDHRPGLPDPDRAASARAELRAVIARRAAYHRRRYGSPVMADPPEPGADPAHDAARRELDRILAPQPLHRQPAADRRDLSSPPQPSLRGTNPPDGDADMTTDTHTERDHGPRMLLPAGAEVPHLPVPPGAYPRWGAEEIRRGGCDWWPPALRRTRDGGDLDHVGEHDGALVLRWRDVVLYDYGDEITAIEGDDAVAARHAVALASARGWEAVAVSTGGDDWQRAVMAEAIRVGLPVVRQDDQQRAMYEQVRTSVMAEVQWRSQPLSRGSAAMARETVRRMAGEPVPPPRSAVDDAWRADQARRHADDDQEPGAGGPGGPPTP